MPNLWRSFESLLPSNPLLLGTVIDQHNDGTLTVQLLDGGLLRVVGDNPIDERVFIRNNKIENTAPNLPTLTIEL